MLEDDAFLEEGQLRALCPRCGEGKHEPFHACERCGLVPEGGDVLKATYLSVHRFADQPDRAARYSRELVGYQQRIRSGDPIVFEQAELTRLKCFVSDGEWSGKYPFPIALLLSMATLFWRPALLVAALFTLILIIRA